MSNGVMDMLVDISALGNLKSSEPLDLSLYSDDKPAFRLPPAGRYTLRAPDSIPAEAFGVSQSGYLTARVDPTIAQPPLEGFQIRYVRISAKPYIDRKGTTISQAGLYLKKFGIDNVPSEPQEIANAIASTAGRTYEAYLDWEAEHRPTGFRVRGMRQFPSDGNGDHQSWVSHPTEKDMEGNPLRVRANLVVKW